MNNNPPRHKGENQRTQVARYVFESIGAPVLACEILFA